VTEIDLFHEAQNHKFTIVRQTSNNRRNEQWPCTQAQRSAVRLRLVASSLVLLCTLRFICRNCVT